MSELAEVNVMSVRKTAESVALSAASASGLAEDLWALVPPDLQSLGNGMAGRAAHVEYQRAQQKITKLAGGISEGLRNLSDALSFTSRAYDAAQGRAIDAILRQS